MKKNFLRISIIALSCSTVVAEESSDNLKDATLMFNQYMTTRGGCCGGSSGAAAGRGSGPSQCCTTITPAFFNGQIKPVDLDNSSTTLYEISTPGSYYVAADLVANPDSNGSTFILISTNDVFLFLNSKSISQTGSTNSNTGIRVASGVSNVKIAQGDVNNITGTGIHVQSSAAGINIESVDVDSCTVRGIYFQGTDGSEVNNVVMDSVTVSNCNGSGNDGSGTGATDGAIGVKMEFVTNGSITNCQFNRNQVSGASDVNGTGIQLEACQDITLVGCVAASNQSIGSGDAYGFRVTPTSKGIEFDNCVARANTAPSTGEVHGFSIEQADSVIFNNCNSQNNISNTDEGPSGGVATGFNFVLSNCMSCCNCSALSNSSTSSHAYGFRGYGSSGSQFNCCKALCNTSTDTTAGFAFIPEAAQADTESSNNVCKDCIAQNNESTGNGGVAYGFLCSQGSGNRIESSQAIGNKANADASSIGVGIGFLNTEEKSAIVKCEISANGSTVGEGYGIKFAETDDSVSKCVVRYNNITSNTGAAATYGFKDFSADMTSLVANNVAFGQGKVFPLTSGAIVDNGNRNYMFTFTQSGESATNMITETDISTLTTIDTAGPWNNISIYAKTSGS